MGNKLKPIEFHSNPWMDDIYSFSTDERKAVIADIKSHVSSLGAEKYIKSFDDEKEFIKTQIIPFIYYIPITGGVANKATHLKFSHCFAGKKHTSLPMVFGMTYDMSKDHKTVDIESVESYVSGDEKVNQILSYAETVSRMSDGDKAKLKDLLIEGIESYRKENQPGSKGWFSDYLRSNKDFKLLGFALNHSYLNVEKKFGQTAPFWIHPWGTPALLYAHRDLPLIMITGPSLRLDENVQGDTNMIGFTG